MANCAASDRPTALHVPARRGGDRRGRRAPAKVVGRASRPGGVASRLRTRHGGLDHVLLRAVRCGKSWKSWKTMPMRPRTRADRGRRQARSALPDGPSAEPKGWPSISIRPSVGLLEDRRCSAGACSCRSRRGRCMQATSPRAHLEVDAVEHAGRGRSALTRPVTRTRGRQAHAKRYLRERGPRRSVRRRRRPRRAPSRSARGR